MIKGHTKIELTDVNTGEVTTYEDTNLVTKAFYDMCQHNGVGGINVFNLFCNKGSNLLMAVTRGLLLYDNQIDEDETQYFASGDGTRLVGCGGNKAYSGAQAMAGSYNGIESGAIENGYKHVWDFSTSQANGHIACACLTTEVGGFITTGTDTYSSDWIGEGNRFRADYASTASGNASFKFPLPADKRGDTSDGLRSAMSCLAINANKNEMLCVKYFFSMLSPTNLAYSDYRGMNNIFRTKQLVLRRYRLPLTKMSPFDTAGYTLYPQLIEDDIVVPMPQELQAKINANYLSNSSYRFWSFVMRTEDYTYITLIFSKGSTSESSSISIAPNEKFYIWEINNDTLESKSIEVTNTIGQAITIYGHYDAMIQPFIVTKEKVLVLDSMSRIYMIDRADNTIVTPVLDANGTHQGLYHSPSSDNGGFVSPFIENNKLYFYKYLYTSDPDSQKHMWVIDLSTGHYSVINCTWRHSPSGNNQTSMLFECRGTMVKVKGKRNLYITDSNVGGTALQVMIPFVHMTINNLETAVDKTPAQTMKVTYTLLEEDE